MKDLIMKLALVKSSVVALLAPLLAGSFFLMGCVSSGEPDRRRAVYRPQHPPPPPPDYHPDRYPPPAPSYPNHPPPGTVHHPEPGHPPPPDGWVVLGTTVANYEADHDTILIRGRYDNFRQLRFQVTGAPLNLHRLVVTYDNGEPEHIRTSQKIKRGAVSRVIHLHGPRSGLRRIDFFYDTRGFSGQRAEVTVFARR
jgi:hypothetical protein